MFNVFKLGVFVIVLSIAYKFFFMHVNVKMQTSVHLTKASEAEAVIKSHFEIYGSPEIVKVTDNVYVAIGFALANMILIEGVDGIIIVDTTESSLVSIRILKEFRKITKKPLKAVVITHFHADHIIGASALLEAESVGDNTIEVFMHESTQLELRKFDSSAQIAFQRASRQFGTFLKHGTEHLDSGIGPRLMVNADTTDLRTVVGTRTFQTQETYTVAGVTFTLLHTPGETDDQITMWIPEWRVVFPADNIYESFPNLYPIRGSPPRSCISWYRSLDQVRRLRAKYMVGSHARPLIGEDEIFETITFYRDAIQFVNDQTIRLLNKGLDVGEIVKRVQLPPSLASHKFLQEFYGKVSWSVRTVYDGHLGWFDGDPVNLSPLTKRDRAARMAKLLETSFDFSLSGVGKLLQEAMKSLKLSEAHFNTTGDALSDELQWALEMSSHALKATPEGSALHDEAKGVCVAILKSLAVTTSNSNARNYYFTYANELNGLTTSMSPDFQVAFIESSAVATIMKLVPTRFAAEACDDSELMTVVFEFSDIAESHAFTMRHCILEYNTDPKLIPEDPDAKVLLSTRAWKDIATKKRFVLGALASGDLVVQGNPLTVRRFMNLVET